MRRFHGFIGRPTLALRDVADLSKAKPVGDDRSLELENLNARSGARGDPGGVAALSALPIEASTAESEAKIAAQRRNRVETAVAVCIFFIIALLHSTSKLSFSEDTDSSALGEVVWGSMYIFACVRLWALRERAWPLLRRSVPIGVWLTICVASTLWSGDPFETFKSSCELVGTTVVAFYLVARFPMLQFVKILAVAYSAITTLSVLLVFGSPSRGKADFGAGPYNGIFADKNGLGLAMALALITIALLILQIRNWRMRICLAVLFMACAGLLAGSNSVTAIAATASVALLSAIAWGIRAKRYGTMFAVFLGTVAASIVAFGILAVDLGELFGVFGRNANLTGRTEMWPGLIDAVKDKPIFGFGYNTFFAENGPVRDYLNGFLVQYSWTPPHAHNSFLQIAIDTGLLGLTAFVVALGIATAQAIAFFAKATDAIALWPFAIILYLVLGSYDETYFGPANTVQWIFFMAALLYPIRDKPWPSRRLQRSVFEEVRAS